MNAVLLATAALGLGTDPAPQPFTIAGYRQLIDAQRAQIKSMSGTYEVEAVPDAGAEKAGLMRGVGTTSRDTFYWSGNKRRRDETSEWVGPDLKKRATETANVYNGSDFRRRESKVLLLQKEKSAYSEMNAYLSTIKWPISTQDANEAAANPDTSLFLPHCLASAGWQILPTPEKVNGISCVVLDDAANRRRMWVDPRRAYCLVRYAHDKPIPGHARWDHTLSEFREVVPGFFLPMTAVCTVALEADPKGNKGTITTKLTVTDLQVNNVPDSVFALEPKPGDKVIDNINGTVYTFTPASDRTLDESAARTASTVEYGERRRTWWRVLVFVVATGLAVGASFLSVRMLMTRNPNPAK